MKQSASKVEAAGTQRVLKMPDRRVVCAITPALSQRRTSSQRGHATSKERRALSRCSGCAAVERGTCPPAGSLRRLQQLSWRGAPSSSPHRWSAADSAPDCARRPSELWECCSSVHTSARSRGQLPAKVRHPTSACRRSRPGEAYGALRIAV